MWTRLRVQQHLSNSIISRKTRNGPSLGFWTSLRQKDQPLIMKCFFRVFDFTELHDLFLFSPKCSLKIWPATQWQLTGCHHALYLNLYFLSARHFSHLDKCFLHLESLAQTMPSPPQDISSWSVFATTDGAQVSTQFGPQVLNWRLSWSQGGPSATVFPQTPARGSSPPVSSSSMQPPALQSHRSCSCQKKPILLKSEEQILRGKNN